jgi:hypothetical protein
MAVATREGEVPQMTADRQDVEVLIAEVRALKRRLRAYGRALLASVALGAGAAVLFVTTPLQSQVQTITASEITIVDSNGNKRGTWSGDGGIVLNNSTLALYSAANVRRMLMNVADDEPTLFFLDAGGKARMYMDVNAKNEARMAMVDDQNKLRLLLSADGQHNPGLSFYDAAGKRRWLANVENDAPHQYLYDANGSLRVYMDGGDYPRLMMYDGAGKRRSILGVNTEGSPVLGLNDAEENQRYLLSVEKDNEPTEKYIDAAGTWRIYTNGGSFPRTVMYDAQRKLRSVHGVDEGGAPFVSLSDADEKRRLLINVENSGGNVYFKDASGNNISTLPGPPAPPPVPAVPLITRP